jgi:RNA polymerase sigma-70 factor (ECF subfamily)
MARTDEELARDARTGSLSAFEELVCRYEGRIFQFLRQRVGNTEDAEDLTQLVFVKAYRALGRFDPSRRLSPWLYTIAHRAAVSHYRARRPDPPPAEEEADRASPDVLVAEREEERGLWQWARSHTSEDQFTALWLRVQEDLSVKEIAGAMRKTRASVKVLLHRGRARLAEAWPPGCASGPEGAALPSRAAPDAGLRGLAPGICSGGETS